MTRERRAMAVMAASLLLLAVAVGTSLRMQLAPRAVPAPPRQLAYDNGLVDALTGWISVYKIGDRSRSWLWLTADGGLTWKRSELAGAPIYTRFFDADHGVVVTEPAADGRNSAQLWATADAGAHWTRAPLPPAPRAAYPQAFFSDLEHGWEIRVGSRNELLRLYRTSDAGANWAGAGLGAGLPLPLTARMTFADAEHGLVFVRPDNRTLRVEATSDGGSTWIDTPLPDPAVAARTSMLPTSARLFAGGIGVFGVHVATAAFQDPVDYVYQTPDGWVVKVELAGVLQSVWNL